MNPIHVLAAMLTAAGIGFGGAFFIAVPAAPPVIPAPIVVECPAPKAPPASFYDLKKSQKSGAWNQ